MNKRNIIGIAEKYDRIIVTSAWLVSTLVYLFLFGIETHLEAGKYIEEADRFIKNGAFSAPRYWFYSTTLFIMVAAFKAGIGTTGAFVLQALLNLFAYRLFYKALVKLFEQKIISLFIVFYLLAFWPYQGWVVFLYTESAFFSTLLILFALLVLSDPKQLKSLLLIGLCVLWVIVSRPLGILFSGGVYAYLFANASRQWKWITGVGAVAVAAVGYFAINAVYGSLSDWTITQAFEQESIICDLPSPGPYAVLDLDKSGSPVYQLFYYLTHNTAHFGRFALTKLEYFFLMTRPYYSKAHNLFLLVNVIIVYGLGIVGLFSRRVTFSRGILSFIGVSILLFTLTILFQCDDYHNRFIGAVFPLLVILAAKGALSLRSFFQYKK